MKIFTTIMKSALVLFLGLILSNFSFGQCTVPVITTISNSGPVCEGESLTLSATGTIGGVSSSSVRMAGIGGNYGNREFDEVFSSGDRTGTIERISEATFNSYPSAAALRARYDVLLFTWASSTSLNAPWSLIEAYLALGGSVFWEDDQNIGDLAPGINGVGFNGSYGCNYVIVNPAPFPVLVDNGVNGCFVNHHLKVNSFPAWMHTYILGQYGENMAVAGIHPTGGGRIIVQGPDQDYHAGHGEGGTSGNQYQFLLNQMDFLTAEQAGFSWTGPNGFTSNEANPVILNTTTANGGVYTATLTNLTGGGCSVSATTTAIVNAMPVITSISNSGPVCEGESLTLSATGTIGGVSSSSVRMAGIGGNYGNREFDEVFSSGDRTGTIERISEATFNSYPSAAALRARYDVLLFTWASSTSLNAPWSLIEAYLALGGSVFWEDDQNIGDLAPGINGVGFNGSYGCNYVIVNPAPFPVLVDNGVNGCFVNHHLKVNSFPAWMHTYILGQYGENMAVAGIHPTGGGRIIVQGPDQDYHAGHGEGGTSGNQYQFLLNQMDFLTAEQAGFSWTGPNGFTSNEANPVILNATTANAGAYTATLSNNAAGECFATATTTVIVNPKPDVTISAAGSTTICVGSYVTLSIPNVAKTTFQWKKNNVNIAGATAASYNASTAGAYSVVATLNGCSDISAYIVVVMDPEAPRAVCQNITVQLNDLGVASIVASDVDGGSTDNCGIASLAIDNANFNCSNIGTNTVVLTVTDNNGNVATCSSTVTVRDTIAPVITCGGDISIHAERNDCSPIITWDEPTASDNCTFTVSSNFNSGDRFPVGTTTVTYTVTDASGNSATCSFNVTVTPDPLVVESLVAKTYTSGHNISCFGKNDGESTVTVLGGCLPYTYLWSDVAAQTSATATGLTAGTYTVTITDANGTITSASITLTQPGLLVADAGLPQTVYFGYAPAACANLTGTSNGGVPAYNYSWSNGATTSGTNVCPNVTTNYVFTVTDVNGCIATDEVTICSIDVRCEYGGEVLMIGQGNKVVICHKYDQKNQNTLCVDASSVAEHLAHGDRLGACGITRTCTQQTSNKAAVAEETEELEHTETNNTIRVFPNPSSGSFNILVNTDETESINITINSINGQVVFQTTQQNQNKLAQIPVELTECSNGMYFLIVQIGDVIMTEKIVINK